MALARSWSNVVTASTGIVAVIGGPLRTGRRRQLEQVIRVTAPLHDGFAGGAVFGASGALLGIATAAHIRGYAVVIPASIAWASASQLLVSGTPRRGYIGVAVQPVELPAAQRTDHHDRALLVIGVSESGPAAIAGVHVGDLIVAADGKPTSSSEDLLDQLSGCAAGETIVLSTLRGGAAREVSIVIGSARKFAGSRFAGSRVQSVSDVGSAQLYARQTGHASNRVIRSGRRELKLRAANVGELWSQQNSEPDETTRLALSRRFEPANPRTASPASLMSCG